MELYKDVKEREGSDLKACEYLAKKYHKGQKYADQDYFKYHIKGVEQMCETLTPIIIGDVNTYDVRCLALLHDILEDTSFDKRNIQYGNSFLYSKLVLITRRKNQEYLRYIEDLIESKDVMVLIVKYADLRFNIRHYENQKESNAYQSERNQKYKFALRLIEKEIKIN